MGRVKIRINFAEIFAHSFPLATIATLLDVMLIYFISTGSTVSSNQYYPFYPQQPAAYSQRCRWALPSWLSEGRITP